MDATTALGIVELEAGVGANGVDGVDAAAKAGTDTGTLLGLAKPTELLKARAPVELLGPTTVQVEPDTLPPKRLPLFAARAMSRLSALLAIPTDDPSRDRARSIAG